MAKAPASEGGRYKRRVTQEAGLKASATYQKEENGKIWVAV